MQLSDAKRERHPASLRRRRANDGRIATPFEIAVLRLERPRFAISRGNKMPEISVPSLRPLLMLYLVLQGDHSAWLQPPVDLVPAVLAAHGPKLQLPTAQA